MVRIAIICILLLVVQALRADRHDNWFSTTESDLRHAYGCVRLPSTSDMENWIRDHFLKPNENRPLGNTTNIHGFELHDQPVSLLRGFSQLTEESGQKKVMWEIEKILAKEDKRKLNNSLKPISGDLSSIMQRAPNCKDVVCAAKLIWGEKEGVKILWSYLRLNFNLSSYQDADGRPFTEREIDSILHAYLLYPKEKRTELSFLGTGFVAIPAEKMRLKSGYNPYAFVDASGRVSDYLKEEIPVRQFGLYIHELAHRVGHDIDADSKNFTRWTQASGWKCDPDFFCSDNKPKILPSKYAGDNNGEDLAETISLYMVSPNKLKTISPKRYAYVKSHYFRDQNIESDICSSVEEEFRASSSQTGSKGSISSPIRE